jgi:choloylglycine hydrolase
MAVAAFIGSLLHFSSLQACTGIKSIAKDGSQVHGRTLEFGVQVDVSIAVVPREFEFVGKTPEGQGLSYKAKYAAVGAMCFGYPALMDGLNEKGLAAGTFYFPGFAGYAKITAENQSKALSPIDFPNWILTQFASVAEVKAALSHVVIAPTIAKDWGSTPTPFHYIVYDKSGACLVIEPIDGKLQTHDNPLGVLTNSPTFDWHMNNLRNYINLTVFNAKPIQLRGVELSAFGQGSGMQGLPGDFAPPSRFVRAAIFSASAIPVANAEEAVYQIFHLLNQFDIPLGTAREKVGDVVYSDMTMITCVRDPQSLKYYFKTYQDQNIQVVDLTKFDFNAKAMKMANTNAKQKVLDVSSQLK